MRLMDAMEMRASGPPSRTFLFFLYLLDLLCLGYFLYSPADAIIK